MARQRKKWLVAVGIIATILVIGAIGSVFVIRRTYDNNLKPVSTSENIQLITVPVGASVNEIAERLKTAGLIRQTWVFEWYVRSQEVQDQLKAGTYALSPNQGVSDIVALLTKGQVATKLVTILPGKRLDQIRAELINAGFAPDMVDKALKPGNYTNHPALVDKPTKASLEGYLYPESFQKDSNTTPQDIITASLDEMQKRLTPSVRNAISKQGLSLHEGITLASIVEQEVSRPEDRPIVAQVFLKRLRAGMKLGSDVTAIYGSVAAGQSPSLVYDSPYNTHIHEGLPPGPISNVTASSINAVAHPANTDYLYFVAGDDGKTYFSHTLEEHEKMVEEHCKKLCNN